jgi:hypothetical protein
MDVLGNSIDMTRKHDISTQNLFNKKSHTALQITNSKKDQTQTQSNQTTPHEIKLRSPSFSKISQKLELRYPERSDYMSDAIKDQYTNSMSLKGT